MISEMALLTMLYCPYIDIVLVGTTKEINLEKNIKIANTSFTNESYEQIMSVVENFDR